MNWEELLLLLISSASGAVFSILFSRLFIERWKENRRINKKHFTDIKNNCLIPLSNSLSELRHYFELGEGGPEWDPYNISAELKQENPWWRLFSFKNRFDVDPLLYEDLKNHYPNLYRDLENVETWIKTKYAEYLQAILNLLRVIEDDAEFKTLKQELEPKGPILIYYPVPVYRQAIIFLALGVDKSRWPNIYQSIKERLDETTRLGNKFYTSTEAEKVRNMIQDIATKIDKCINNIKEVMLKVKLEGKCKYLK
jgi:hypothetical protein